MYFAVTAFSSLLHCLETKINAKRNLGGHLIDSKNVIFFNTKKNNGEKCCKGHKHTLLH